MSSAFTNAVNLILEINSGHGSYEDYENLKMLLSNIAKSDVLTLTQTYQLTNIFRHVDWSSRRLAELGYDLATLIFSAFSWREVLGLLESEIVEGLKSGNDNLIKFFLQQLETCFKGSQNEMLCEALSENVLFSVIRLLGHNKLEIVCLSQKVIKAIAHVRNGDNFLFENNRTVDLFKSTCAKPEERIRLHEITVDIASYSQNSFELVLHAGFLDDLLNDIENDDFLIQLNCLEVLKDLVSFEEGVQFLKNRGTLEKLQEKLSELDHSPFGDLLFPGYITFFGRLARLRPEDVLQRFPSFWNTVYKCFMSEDLSRRVLAVETYGHIAFEPQGKVALQQASSDHMNQILHGIGQLMKSAPHEIRVRAVDAFRYLIHMEASHLSTDLCALTQSWFASVRDSPHETMHLLMQVVAQPFLDIRIAGLRVLKTMAIQRWGQEMFDTTPGFKDYLLNRNTEHEKPSIEEKYELIRVLAESPFTVETLGRPYCVQLQEFVSQGAFYVLAQAQVDLAQG